MQPSTLQFPPFKVGSVGVSKKVTMTKFDGVTLLMKIKMPQNSFCRSWPIKTHSVIFSLCPYFCIAKVPTSLSLFVLDAFHLCFFSIFLWFLVCKTTFKGYYEISLQKRLCHERTVHPLKWWAHPSFEKVLKTDPNFQYVIKWDANKNQDRPLFRICRMFM